MSHGWALGVSPLGFMLPGVQGLGVSLISVGKLRKESRQGVSG